MDKLSPDIIGLVRDYIDSFPEGSEGYDFAQRVIYGALPQDKQCWPNVADRNGVTPVLFLQRLGARSDTAQQAFSALEKLVVHPLFDLNHCDCDGNTMLHYAAQHDHADMVKCLLAHKADATIRNKKGLTAPELATGKNVEDLFRKPPKREAKEEKTEIQKSVMPDQAATQEADTGWLQREIEKKIPEAGARALLTSLMEGDNPVAVKVALTLGADIFTDLPVAVPGAASAQQIWQLALILRRERAFAVMLQHEPALWTKDPTSRIYKFIDSCGYSSAYKPALWGKPRAVVSAVMESETPERIEEKLLTLLYSINTKSRPLTSSKATKILLTVLQQGDYPKTVQYLMRHGADASAAADAPVNFFNIGSDREKKGRIWQWAIERERVKSFEQICLWTQDWHKNKKSILLERDVLRFRTREALLKATKNIVRKNSQSTEKASDADNAWLVRGITYARLREKYATTKEETLRLVFSIAGVNGHVDQMTAAGAELMCQRKNWIGQEKEREALNGRDVSTAIVLAVLREDYLFAEALAEKRGHPFNPAPDVLSAFKKSASAEAKAWLKENTRTGYVAPPPAAVTVKQ